MKIKMTFIILGVIIGLILLSTQVKVYRFCGHTQSLYNKYVKSTMKTHCCHAGRLISELNGLYLGEKLFYKDNGHYATSLVELVNYCSFLPQAKQYYTLNFEATTSNWQCMVFKTQYLPGNYWLTSDGKIYFNENQVPDKKRHILTRF